MKSKDIASVYKLDQQWLDHWIPQTNYRHKAAWSGGIEVEDGQDIAGMVNQFKAWYDTEMNKLQIAQANEQQAIEAKQKELATILITSGFNFDGHTITKYSGYISGDDVIQIPRGGGGWFNNNATDVGDALMKSLVVLRRNALNELKEAAYALGCNAVIGVDFDYLTFEPETVNNQGGTLYLPYVFGVTANGNAVIIEKSNSSNL